MSFSIKQKTSTVPGKAPLPADIERGELAVNLADKKIYTKDQTDAIVELGGGGGGAMADITDYTDVMTGVAGVAATLGAVTGVTDAANGPHVITPAPQAGGSGSGLTISVDVTTTGANGSIDTFKDYSIRNVNNNTANLSVQVTGERRPDGATVQILLTTDGAGAITLAPVAGTDNAGFSVDEIITIKNLAVSDAAGVSDWLFAGDASTALICRVAGVIDNLAVAIGIPRIITAGSGYIANQVLDIPAGAIGAFSTAGTIEVVTVTTAPKPATQPLVSRNPAITAGDPGAYELTQIHGRCDSCGRCTFAYGHGSDRQRCGSVLCAVGDAGQDNPERRRAAH